MSDDNHLELANIELDNAMRNIAHMASTFFDALVAEGFNSDAALMLTESWLRTTVENSKQ